MAKWNPAPTRRHPARLAWLAPFLALALALSGCLFALPPAVPTAVPPTPTPVPTPTPSVQQRVAFPTPTAAPTATARPTSAPTATPIGELAGAGELLYIGTVGGKAGIVAVNTDGTRRRLLVEGRYQAVKWAPDGRRFFALTARSDTQTNVILFNTDGHLLKRFSLAGNIINSAWAPDSRHVAVTVYIQPSSDGSLPAGAATWILTEAGAVEVQAGQYTPANPWSSRGRLTITASSERGWLGLWTVDATGNDARLVTREPVSPTGWSADGGTLFALGELKPAVTRRGISSGFTALVAFDLDTGVQRTIITTAGLPLPSLPDAPNAQPTPTPEPGATAQDVEPALRRFLQGAVSPLGDRIALWVSLPVRPRGNGPTEPWHLVVVTDDGRLVWQAPEVASTFRVTADWAPDGSRLAHTYGQPSRGGAWRTDLRVTGIDSDEGITTVARTVDGPLEAAWAPDGRWLALAYPGHLDVVSGALPARAWQLDGGGTSPAWRPRGGP